MEFLSKGKGIGGSIKDVAEDFVVEEITATAHPLELNKTYSGEELDFPKAKTENPKFSAFVLQKTNWNTSQALRMVAKRFRRGIASTGFAGTKDRTAVSTQLCSIFGVKPEELANFHVKDIKINGAWASDSAVKLGDLLGNRFTMMIRDVERKGNVQKIADELKGIFPNYFGEQRFGFRNNNVAIGLDILKGDSKSAVMKFLTDSTNEKNDDAIVARKRLADNLDFKAAIEYFPRYLKYELLMIDYLSRFPTDFGNAIRKIPRSMALMFVHSIDSYIFNTEIDMRIEIGAVDPQDDDVVCAIDKYGFPDLEKTIDKGNGFAVGNIVGYDNKINSFEQKILDELEITQEQFKVRNMPELNCKGAKRALFAPYVDLSHEEIGDDVKMKFSLPSGSYATVLLNEFMKVSKAQ